MVPHRAAPPWGPLLAGGVDVAKKIRQKRTRQAKQSTNHLVVHILSLQAEYIAGVCRSRLPYPCSGEAQQMRPQMGRLLCNMESSISLQRIECSQRGTLKEPY
eukprot:scaffold1185_cov24-Tisochrysis_lutea.AAC.1